MREGIIQLGSFSKVSLFIFSNQVFFFFCDTIFDSFSVSQVAEDLNLVINIQRKFSYLQSIPGIYAIQRPYLPLQHPYTYKPNNPSTAAIEACKSGYETEDKRTALLNTPSKRTNLEELNNSPVKSMNLGYNSPQNNALPLWSIPPLFPSMPCSLGALLSKPSSYTALHVLDTNFTPPTRPNGCGESSSRDNRFPDMKMEAKDELDSFLLSRSLEGGRQEHHPPNPQ